MAKVSAVSAVWTVGIGGPGVGKYWFNELLDATARQAAVDSVRSLLFTAGSALKTTWSIQVGQTIQNFDLTTGQLTDEVLAGTKPPLVSGSFADASAHTAGVGARILWRTGVVLGGRKVVGRSFLVPLAGVYASNGNISSTFIGTMKTAITTYVTQPSARPVVWHKTFSKPTDPDQKPVYLGGNAVPIQSGDVLDPPSSLRSRRY